MESSLFLELNQAISSMEKEKFINAFKTIHDFDKGVFFKSLSPDSRKVIYGWLTPLQMSDVFDSIDTEAASYLKELPKEYRAKVISEMFTDNAVRMFSQLSDEEVSQYMKKLPTDVYNDIKKGLDYSKESAGGLMSLDFVEAQPAETVSNVIKRVSEYDEQVELVYYIFVVDQGKLLGVLSLRDLLMADDNMQVSEVMSSTVISVTSDEHQLQVAKKIKDYDLLAVPVVDAENTILGVITVDDILDVVVSDALDNYSKLAGVDVSEVHDNPLKSSIKRLPWLITLLFLGMATATLIGHYEDLVSEASVLAVFISLITGTSGNAGTQSLAVAVRRLAIKDDKNSSVLKLIGSELLTGLISGVVTGLTIMVVVGLWKQNFMLGFVIGIAMMFAITVGNLAGSLIPMLMDKLGFDPAVASGPFITTLSDLTSVLIYFNIASLFMGYFI